MCSSASGRSLEYFEPIEFLNESTCANDSLSSNQLPLQHQEPPRPTHRPRSSPQLVVSIIFTFNISSSSTSTNRKPHDILQLLSWTFEIADFRYPVPQIVIGNRTVTPNPNPVGLSIFNGSFTGHPVTAAPTGVAVYSSGGVVIYSTGTGSGSSFTAGPQIFQGAAPLSKVDAWLAVWVTGLLAFGGLVYYL